MLILCFDVGLKISAFSELSHVFEDNMTKY